MARSIQFPEANDVATSLTRSNVGGLHAKFFNDHSVSCWQLSPEELAEVQRTGLVWVRTDLIEGKDGNKLQPAIAVTTQKQFALG